MAKLLFYIRTFPITFILVVASFSGTLWLLWPLSGVGALLGAAIMSLGVFISCGLVGTGLVLLFDAIKDVVSFDPFD